MTFTIVTDYHPLTWIFSVKGPSSRLLRWFKLEEYEYQVIYKRVLNNTNADEFSRIQVTESSTHHHYDKSGLIKKEKQQYFRKCMTDKLEVIWEWTEPMIEWNSLLNGQEWNKS